MATDRQIAANRRNAQKSTGPKTDETKQVSKANAWKHGLAATTMLFCPRRHEDATAFHGMRNDLMTSWQPEGMKEVQLVEMIAGAYARMQRLENIESGYMDGALASMQRRFGFPDTPTEQDDFGSGIAMGDEKHQLTFETLDRYRRNAWLDYDRAVRRLEAMQKARRDQAIGEKEEQLREAQRQKKSRRDPSRRDRSTHRIRNRRNDFRRIGFVPENQPSRQRNPLRKGSGSGEKANPRSRIRQPNGKTRRNSRLK